MSQNKTIIMDRSKTRIPCASNTTPTGACAIPPGERVFYTGKKFSKAIGISSGRIGIVDARPISPTGAISVSFERKPREPKPGEEPTEAPTDKAPEAFLLSPSNLRPVPKAALDKREEQRRQAQRQAA